MQQGSAGPALWSAEEPNLYILVLSLIGPDGSHIESESCQVHLTVTIVHMVDIPRAQQHTNKNIRCLSSTTYQELMHMLTSKNCEKNLCLQLSQLCCLGCS